MHGLWMSKRTHTRARKKNSDNHFIHFCIVECSGSGVPHHTHRTHAQPTKRARPTMRLTSTANVARLHFYYSHSPIYLRSKLNNNAARRLRTCAGLLFAASASFLNFPSPATASTLPLRVYSIEVSCLALCAFFA